jgi:hypothetical protein
MKTRTTLYFSAAMIAFAFLLSSCGPSLQERRDEIEKSMQFWVGKTETQLVAKWGPPSNTYDLADGARELTYYYHHPNYYHSFYYGGYNWRSERGFTVDSTGKIIAYRWDGF